MITYGSVCSGVEAASLAWEPLGWEPQWFSEIDAFPSAVLAERWPDVPNLGDMTRILDGRPAAMDILVGGTPCQSFSVSGLRAGLDDERGNLTREYCRLVSELRPRWFVWENVPGVLSSNGGRDFGSILGAMVELGYGVAYRVLDAKNFGVPQRRRRVFVVGHSSGAWQRAAAVLFDTSSLRRDSAPRRESGDDIASGITAMASDVRGDGADNLIVSAFFDPNQVTHPENRSKHFDQVPTLNESLPPVVINGRQNPITSDEMQPLDQHGGTNVLAFSQYGAVRRLTPLECERAQGFPDGHTAITYNGKPAKDTPRYKAIGNSMAVPCMRWIGERIQFVDSLESPAMSER